jgi:hypothetical protein
MPRKATTVVSYPIDEAVAVQCDWLIKLSKRVAERGYCVCVVGLNNDMAPDHLQYMFSYMAGGFTQLLDNWNNTYGTRYLKINVSPNDKVALLDGEVSFSCIIPKRVWSRELLAALSLCSAYKKHKSWKERQVSGPPKYEGSGLFSITESSDFATVNGSSKLGLQTFLRILEMPQHRAALTQGGSIHASV